jgi:Fe-S-cluster containining protein
VSRELERRLAGALAQPARAWAEAAAALAELRPMDPAGAAAVLEADPEVRGLFPQGPEAAVGLARRLEALAAARRCLGCGTCCRTSSPTLYAEDLERLGPAGIPRRALYCLRAGETVHSARLGRRSALERELIKLAEAPAGGCRFREAAGCAVYDSRPLQCRVLECWSARHAGMLEGRPRLDRARLLAGDETALALAAEYDAKLPAVELARALEAAAAGDSASADQALAMLELDHRLREGAARRYGYGPEDLALMWGRPGLAVAAAYGLAPARGPGGGVVLGPAGG